MYSVRSIYNRLNVIMGTEENHDINVKWHPRSAQGFVKSGRLESLMTGWFLHIVWCSRQLRPRIRRNIAGIFLKKIMKTLNNYYQSRLLSIARPNEFTLCSSVCLYIYHQLQVICVLIHEVSCREFIGRHVATMVTNLYMLYLNPSPLTHFSENSYCELKYKKQRKTFF